MKLTDKILNAYVGLAGTAPKPSYHYDDLCEEFGVERRVLYGLAKQFKRMDSEVKRRAAKPREIAIPIVDADPSPPDLLARLAKRTSEVQGLQNDICELKRRNQILKEISVRLITVLA